ncbi:hypothetical protein AB8J26_001549 [Clostridium perfringens]|uniref:hypothetical protein n=1 Tax=Clostridium perfringens TaxID=1502 RepID=UPI0037DBA737|nr:hypothetical protein [Clostridium perfringens]
MFIKEIKIFLDDNVPEYMDGIIRIGDIQYLIDGRENEGFISYSDLNNSKYDLVDNIEYHDEEKLISDVAERLNISRNIIFIEE